MLENYFQEGMTPADKDIGKAVKDISTDVTEDKLELTFDIGPNEWIKEGVISRKYFMQDGQPTKCDGDKVVWLKEKPESILSKILDGGVGKEEVMMTFPLIGELINDMVPYSLQFYLGISAEDEVDENEIEEEYE